MSSYYTKIAHAVQHKDPQIRDLASALLRTLDAADATPAVMMEAVEVARKCLHRSIETSIVRAAFGDDCADRVADDDILLEGGHTGGQPNRRRRARRKSART